MPYNARQSRPPAHLLLSQQALLLLQPLLHLLVGGRKLLLLLLPALQRRAGGWGWGWAWQRWLHLLLRSCWLQWLQLQWLRLQWLRRRHWLARHSCHGALPRHRRGRRQWLQVGQQVRAGLSSRPRGMPVESSYLPQHRTTLTCRAAAWAGGGGGWAAPARLGRCAAPSPGRPACRSCASSRSTCSSHCAHSSCFCCSRPRMAAWQGGAMEG